MNPLVSIVIPTLNQGQYIEQTICSIINQSYKNIEMIIIDGGSTDNTLPILEKYSSKIKYWISEPDNGQAHAINKGLEKCEGQIFNWINSDDFLELDAIGHIVKAFEENNKAQLVCGYTHCFYDKNKSTSHEYRMGIKSTIAETIVNVEMNQPGSFYLTKIVKELGGVNESLRYVFDDELWFKYLCKYGSENIQLLKSRVANFRLHGSSKSIGEGFEHFSKEIQSLFIDIASKTNMPLFLLDLMKKESYSEKYISKGEWTVLALEKSLFNSHFANRYINTLFLLGQKYEAKQAQKLLIRNGLFKLNRVHISLFLKLIFK